MSKQKIILDDTDDDVFTIGLVKIQNQMPSHEFFFKFNEYIDFFFRRADDIVLVSTYYEYHFAVYEGYCEDSKTVYTFISNQSIESFQIKEIQELFIDEQDVKFLLTHSPEIDYILMSSDTCPDFSLFLNLEKNNFQFQTTQIGAEENDLFPIILYHE